MVINQVQNPLINHLINQKTSNQPCTFFKTAKPSRQITWNAILRNMTNQIDPGLMDTTIQAQRT